MAPVVCERHDGSLCVQVKAHYRRARQLKLGDLTIKRPLFLEMPIGGLVRGAPGPVVGVVGYDLWRRWASPVPTAAVCSHRSSNRVAAL